MLAAKVVSEFKRSGYFVIPSVIDEVMNRRLRAFVGGIANGGAGSRRLLDEAWCTHLGNALRNDARIRSLLPRSAVAVQCTLFDKSPAKNWLVSLHQDLSIPVVSRVDEPGLSGWSEKEGQLYVQPPVSVLEQLVAVRVHIDDCTSENGALRVVPASHAQGRVDQKKAESLREQHGETLVPVARGGALVMPPLILHASSKAITDAPRRVLHCVWADVFAVGARMAVGGLAEDNQWRIARSEILNESYVACVCASRRFGFGADHPRG
jgi:hypothetical protein